MKLFVLPKLGIIKSLLQSLNEILQNIKISTIIYSVCVCVLTGLRGWTVWPNYEVVFQASVSDCSIPRLCWLLLCILPIPSRLTNTLHIHHTGSSAHLGVPCLRPRISDFHTRSLAHLGVACLCPSIPITHPYFLSLLFAVLLHAHLPTAHTPPFIFPWVFQGGPKFFCRLLAPPHLPPLPSSFIPCLHCTYLK